MTQPGPQLEPQPVTGAAILLQRLKTLHPKLIDLSLDRITGLLAQLGHPERHLPPVIHIAGTNGKGSTTAFLRAMFEGSGLRVHAYTSPHLVRFHERISVPGPDGVSRPISEVALVDLLTRVEAANGAQPMTFFEITTAAAFLAFAETPADVVLLEVGLGGEFDATNVIAATALSVITPIAFDHMDKLGRTLAEIAKAKAGILKRAVPAIVGPQPDEAMAVLARTAQRLGAPLTVWGQDFDAYGQAGRLVVQTEDTVLDLPLPALVGPHQIINAGVAVMAARAMRHLLPTTDAGIALGLQRVLWPGRMQPLTTGRLRDLLPTPDELWLDGAHNPAGGRVLADTITDLNRLALRPLTMIVGMMGQKDADGFLQPFKNFGARLIVVPVPGTQEAPADPTVLAGTAVRLGFQVETAGDIPDALARIGGERAPTGRRVLICGSLYLAGHVLALNEGLDGVVG